MYATDRARSPHPLLLLVFALWTAAGLLSLALDSVPAMVGYYFAWLSGLVVCLVWAVRAERPRSPAPPETRHRWVEWSGPVTGDSTDDQVAWFILAQTGEDRGKVAPRTKIMRRIHQRSF